MHERDTKLIKSLFYIFFVASISIILFNIYKPVFWDEVGWLHGAYSFRNNLKIIYLSENAMKGLGLWYPSVYFFIIKLAAIYFQSIEVGIRLFNLFCFITSIVFLFKIGMHIFKDKFWTYLLTLIYCITPFIIQGILLIEIDTSILSLAVIYSLYLIILSIESTGSISFRTEIFVYILIGFSKIIFLPIIILAVVLFNFLVIKKITKLFTSVFTVFISSCIIMLLWVSLCRMNDANPYYFITFTLKRAGDSHSFFSLNQFKEIAVGIFRKSIWLTPYFFILYILSIYFFLKKKILSTKPAILFTAILSIIAFSFYIFIGLDAAGYPKYLYPATAPVVVLFVYFFKEMYLTKQLVIQELSFKGILAGVVIFTLIIFLIGDPIYNFITYKYGRNLYLDDIIKIKDLLFNVYRTAAAYFIIPILFFCYIYFKIKSFFVSFSLAMLLSLISFNLSVYAKQSYTQGSTLYMYSIEGVQQTVKTYGDRVVKNNNNVLPAEIGYYTSKAQRYYDIDGLLQDGTFLEIIMKENPDLIVIRDQNWGDNNRVKQIRDFIRMYNKKYGFSRIRGYQIYMRL